MPQPRTPEAWRQLVSSCLAQNEGMPPREIRLFLEDTAEGNEGLQRIKDRLPSTRTIERIRAEWKLRADSEKAPYRLYRWPDSHQSKDLPWEAASAALELCYLAQRVGDNPPSIRVARWFWRLTQAVPDLPAYLPIEQPSRYSISRQMAAWDALGNLASGHSQFRGLQAIEAYLAFAPWRSPQAGAEYDAAISRGNLPDLPPLVGFVAEDVNDPRYGQAYEDAFGLTIEQYEEATGEENHDNEG